MRKLSPPSDSVPLARRLRRDGTDAERRLWRHLRNRGLDGHKFRRQHPIAGFVADFACVEARLVVEVDGGQHGGAADARRTAALHRHGFTVLRFWNNEVLVNTEGVIETIRAFLKAPPT
ncbi:MAG: endonuclease domain-containing protein [Rhodospirillales bacterium]|nr:MAG: endonuclease domain-containing protein [Rhodospirillales bacterium]